MRAVHWLRSRQEERELIYWLSITAYDVRDRSINNRIYLLYLIVFFSIWIFMTLTLFASGGAVVLLAINPANPGAAAAFLAILILGAWSIFALWRSLRRSPVTFSEEDTVLICQMPVSRRQVVLRWLWMPWLKSALPFWLAAVVLGFSIAEVTMPGTLGFDRIFEYAGYGVRAWLVIIPIQLALFVLVWIAGVYRLHKDVERRGLAWAALLVDVALSALLLVFTFNANIRFPLNAIAHFAILPIQAGFGTGNLSIPVASMGLLALVMLVILYFISGTFSMSRAGQETNESDTLNTAVRFGLSSEAERLRTRKRLGVARSQSRLPDFPGAGALVWKDALQSQRLFRLTALFNWLTIFGIVFSLPLLPGLSVHAILIVIWVIQVGKVSVVRVRNDLTLWSLIRQLPISNARFLLADLSLPYLLAVFLSLIGLGLGAIVARQPVDILFWLVPGAVAAVVGTAAFDVIRRARIHQLMTGSAPEMGAGGALLGIIFVALPLLASLFLPGIVGVFFGVMTSLLLGWLAFLWAVSSYSNINSRG